MKSISISILCAAALIVGAILISQRGSSGAPGAAASAGSNVSIVDGKQIIEIQARGGYQPRASSAKAGLPTIVRFETNGTFDCSASVRFPSLGISKFLPQTGATDIDIGTSTVSTLHGSCGMGMYPFEIDFAI